MRVRLLPFVLAAVGAGLTSCAPPGDEVYAGWSTFTSEQGFQFRFLAPPFEERLDVPVGEAHLLVPSEHDDEVPTGLPRLPPSFDVRARATPPERDSLTEANRKHAEFVARTDTVEGPPSPLSTRSGLTGYEVYSQDRTHRRYRSAFFIVPGALLEVHVELYDDPHMRDLDDLVESFEARP